MPNPLLVATDGGRSAASALELAAAYASRTGVPVEVVSVVERLTDLLIPLPHREELEQANAQAVADRVREQVRSVAGGREWPIHVRLGRPAPDICATARQLDATMIVLGLDSGAAEGSLTAVELLHLAEKPVLVARGGALPRRAVVGVDFRASSQRAAAEAVHLVGPGGVLHLVHVKPSLDFPAASVWGWGRCYECAVEGAFDGLAQSLGELGAREIHHHCRSGHPAEELLRAAEELEADLIAVGGDGYVCNGRAVVGRVARRILAEAPTTVLATPVTTRVDGAGESAGASGAARPVSVEPAVVELPGT